MATTTLRWVLFGLSFLIAANIHAQTACPPGMTPYGNGVCGYDNSQQQPAQQQKIQPQSPPQWADHWGAIAADSANGILGTATAMTSRKVAEDAALADCQSKGGAACMVQLSYGNQCAVVVVGDQGYNATQGATSESAKQAGMKVCNEADSHCHLYYSDCSLPVRVQ